MMDKPRLRLFLALTIGWLVFALAAWRLDADQSARAAAALNAATAAEIARDVAATLDLEADNEALRVAAADRFASANLLQLTLLDASKRQVVGVWPGAEPTRPLRDSDKPIYDLSLALRAALDTNRAEGRNRKPDVVVQSFRDRIEAAAPVLTRGVAHGMVLIAVPPNAKDLGSTSDFQWTSLFAALVAAAAALCAAFIAPRTGWVCTTAGVGAIALAGPPLAARASSPGDAITLTVAALIGAGLLIAIARGWHGRLWTALATHRDAYLAVAPAILGALVLVFFPFFYGLALSFTDTTLFNQEASFVDRFVGLENYARILGDTEVIRRGEGGAQINAQNFYWTLFITVTWTICNVTLGVAIGLGLALLLNTPGLKHAGLYRVLLILPWAVPNYITALVWRGMFHPQYGVVNQALQVVGVGPVQWFDHVWTAFLTGLAANVWLSFPFMMVVSLGALQSINKEMYEAAHLEGASPWRRFVDITLPNLRPALIPAVILSVVWTFNMFNVIYLVSGGEPAGANEILVTQAYKLGFEQYQYGYAAAYSVVIFALLFVYGTWQTRVTRATERA